MNNLMRQINEHRDPCRITGLLRTGLENFSFSSEFVSPSISKALFFLGTGTEKHLEDPMIPSNVERFVSLYFSELDCLDFPAFSSPKTKTAQESLRSSLFS